MTWANPKRAHLYSALFNAQLPAAPNDRTMGEIHVKILCDSFGWEYSDELVHMSIALSPENEQYADGYFRQFNDAKTVLINTTAGNDKREMTQETVEELIELLLKFYPNMHILLNVAPAETHKFSALCELFPENVHILPYSSDVLNFCALVKKCSTVISPDTAVVHIASAFEIPIVGIFNNSVRHAKQWGPQHRKSVVVMSTHQDDLRIVTSEQIFRGFQQLNNNYQIV
ncbi:MAG: hypothetical protein IPM69_08170 [Ignavibacteria bacterium]|nr:hypothetical protein [Ignavibacteria bacterium]